MCGFTHPHNTLCVRVQGTAVLTLCSALAAS
jgi:hypothetical protein